MSFSFKLVAEIQPHLESRSEWDWDYVEGNYWYEQISQSFSYSGLDFP